MLVKVSLVHSTMKGIIALTNINKNDIIYSFHLNFVSEPTRTSIQFEDRHFEDDIGKYLNHHCNPNAKIDSAKRLLKAGGDRKIVLRAINTITKDEEITFDYNSTESLVSHPFYCRCHNKLIKGRDYSGTL
mgnify:CR=1 FL=1|jgi:SET domain-containing protein|tara:strand:- start:1726 stop:2118 length:393 start_codon:yes stop_codon:yes gene_type:complete